MNQIGKDFLMFYTSKKQVDKKREHGKFKKSFPIDSY